MSSALPLSPAPPPTPKPRPGKRPFSHWWRKLLALMLVLSSIVTGIVGLGIATSGNFWGIGLIALTPFGIWLAMRVTPEAGTTGYLDKNL